MNAPAFHRRGLDTANLSADQYSGFQIAQDWIARGDQQVLKCFGYAGTGKTSLAKLLASGVRKVVYGAYTGKAALQMRRSGCAGAMTLHSMLYEPKHKADGTVEFLLNLADGPASDADLICVDEVSMVGHDIGKDLLRLGKKILVLGDPGQLPPVNGSGYFTVGQPEIFLSTIHRQAAGNPIIELSRRVREGYDIEHGDYGAVQVIRRGVLSVEEARRFDTILVGKNVTREVYNKRIRASYDRNSPMPVIGDKIIALRNCSQTNILNGQIFKVVEIPNSRDKKRVKLKLRPEEDAGDTEVREVSARLECFFGGFGDLSFKEKRGSQHLAFGNAITVHKSQGSQWGSVLCYDESGVFGEDAWRWLYTGITRASERLTLVKS